MKKIIFFLLLPLRMFGHSTYYVDNLSGNDTYNGTSKTTAWKTLTKVNAVAFIPGDSILFKCGGTWNGTLTISSSGSTVKNIVFSKYGIGANPVISGFDTLTGWVKNNNNTWSITDGNLGTTLNLVSINGVNQPIGRLPRTGYNTFSAANGNASITDPAAVNLPSLIGGTLVIRKNHWIMDRGTITAQSNGTISYSNELNAGNYKPIPGHGYFVQNHINCLTQFGDWCYDANTHKLTMYFGSKQPASYVIKAARYATLINIPVAKSLIDFVGIDFEGANNYGLLAVNNCNYISFNNCNFTNIGQDGLKFNNGNHITVKNCSIVNCNNNGFCNVNGTYNMISYSTVKNIHSIAGMGQSGDSNGLGIAFTGANPSYCYNNTVSFNTVSNIGYIGIYINGNGFVVQNNHVDTFGTNKDDCGGIYTYVGATDYSYSQRRIITNNIISNGIGAAAGTPLPIASSAHGIYLDDNSSEVTVSNNQVTHCAGAGINANTNRDCSYTNNNISDCGSAGILFAQVRFSDSNRVPSKPQNLVFTGNTLTSNGNGQLLVSFLNNRKGSTIDDFHNWGNFSNNNLKAPANAALFFRYAPTDKWPGTAVNFSDWQKTMKMETVSVFKILK